MDYLAKFNETFEEFLADMIRAFPDDADLRMYQVALGAALMLSPRKLFDSFYKHVVVPYEAFIMARDEQFFLNTTYNQVRKHDVVDKIKKMWHEMSGKDRDIVWKYFKLLVLLSRKICT